MLVVSLFARKSLIFGLFLTVFLQGRAQTIKRFTPDSVVFLSEMEHLLSNSRKDESKEFIKSFEPLWYGGHFDTRQRLKIYQTANMMLDNHMRAYPDFINYMRAIKGFAESTLKPMVFDNWHEALENVIKGKGGKTKFSRYLQFSEAFFSDHALYKSASCMWQASNNRFEMHYDKEPFITYNNIDLRCFSKGDSSVVHMTSGVYYPLRDRWVGKGGKIDWARAGFDPNEVYAVVDQYKLNLKTSSYKIDSVHFFNVHYFSKPLLGLLEEKVMANVVQERATYPRFKSYDARLKIKSIVEGVDYEGAFSQQGAKFAGAGQGDEDAVLTFYRNNKVFLRASSGNFSIREDKIVSTRTQVVMYLEYDTDEGHQIDSIYHPGLKFNFLTNERKLLLLRGNTGVAKSPWFNTYHKIDMYFDQFVWKLDDDQMTFTPMTAASKRWAIFESVYYYKEDRFDKIQGMSDTHPFYQIKKCFRQHDTDELPADIIAGCMHASTAEARPFLMNMASQGFIYYNYEDNSVRLNEKLLHYMNAKSEKEDYDVVQFVSNINKKIDENAVLNLKTYDLKIKGIDRIFLSDSQNVYLYPLYGEIILKKNRDFLFDGIVNAGKFEYFGRDYSFSYNNFKIDMPVVDSLRIYVQTDKLDKNGHHKERRVKTVIQNIRGELAIDQPGNKSGLKSLAEYPIFKSLDQSYVYYQKKSIQGGVYKKDKFYFQVYPFEIDSLDNFRDEDLKIKGNFVSAGIFPDFEEYLTLQPDYSLGFIRRTPPGGYDIYGAKGHYEDEIGLSHHGLEGAGTLKYLTSTTQSDEIMFYPDSLNALAKNYVVEEQMAGTEYPPVSATGVKIHWEPYKDFMTAHMVKSPLVFYDGNSKLHGALCLRPEGMTGKGTFKFEGAELDAKLIKFKFQEFDSDTVDFRLQALNSSDIAFKTSNFKAHISFKERKGEFLSNGGGEGIVFPINQYMAYMNRFTWYMDNDDIELSADTKAKPGATDLQLEGAKFISIHPKQDSLSFFSKAARYNLRTNLITANKVRFINVADAIIYPDSQRVIIEPKAKMRTLENARILANYITQYHNIYNANINVLARKDYVGSGDVDYIDENKRKQVVHLTSIQVDSSTQTVGHGRMTDEDAFTLSPNFAYRGDIYLEASEQFLTFKGESRISHECDQIRRNWFYFEGQIDPGDIYIPIDTNLVDDNKNRLTASVMLATDSIHIYSAFLSKIRKRTDQFIIPATGFLHYDKGDKTYKISNMQKLSQMQMPGNYLELDKSKCMIYGEGRLNLGANLGQVIMTSVGNIAHDLAKDTVYSDVLMLIDFFFNDNALDQMAKVMLDYNEEGGLKYDRPVFEKGIRELVGVADGDKLISQLTLYGQIKKMPKDLEKSLFITDLKLIWDADRNAWESVGQIGISNVLKKQVSQYVDGHIEIQKKRSGDIMTIYLELNKEKWFFFKYQRNIMQAISSDADFNTIVKETKSDKRKMKHEKGTAPYSFMMSNEVVKRKWLNDIEDKY